MKKYVHGEPVFSTTVLIIKNCSIKTYNQQLRKYGYTGDEIELETTNEGATIDIPSEEHEKGFSFWSVWIRDEKENNGGAIIHEAYHLVQGILHEKGIPLTKENDEVGAYLLDYWVKVLRGIIQQ